MEEGVNIRILVPKDSKKVKQLSLKKSTDDPVTCGSQILNMHKLLSFFIPCKTSYSNHLHSTHIVVGMQAIWRIFKANRRMFIEYTSITLFFLRGLSSMDLVLHRAVHMDTKGQMHDNRSHSVGVSCSHWDMVDSASFQF